jgi:hypothetical protein
MRKFGSLYSSSRFNGASNLRRIIWVGLVGRLSEENTNANLWVERSRKGETLGDT